MRLLGESQKGAIEKRAPMESYIINAINKPQAEDH